MTFVNDFQEKIWRDKYQYKDETYEGFCERVAYPLFANDKQKAAKLKAAIMDFRILFGGRINSNIGTDEGGLTLFNCFIESISKEPDSLEGIMEMATNYALTLKTEGGVGFCANFFRPAKTLIRKIGVTSPGSIKFLEVFDKISEVITSGSVDKDDSFQGIPTKNSIRKGATMVTMNVNHPDIEEFITAKSIPNKLTKMNMSVLITDAFMYAVDNDLDWDLWFPDINCEEYDVEWDGNFEKWAEKGLATVVYKTVHAVDLWELLLRSSYTRNEPGLLFIDTIRRMDNINYLESSITATNPSLRAGTRVITTNGIFPIEELENKEFDVFNLDGKSASAKCCLSGHDQPLYKITLSGGVYYYATKEHKWPVMCPTGYVKKETSELSVGAYIPTSAIKTSLPFGNMGSYDDGFLIGWNLGDGSSTVRKDGRKQFSFICSEKDKENGILDKILLILKEITGKQYSPTRRTREGKPWYELHLSDVKLRHFFEKFGFISKTAGLPKSVWSTASDVFRKGLVDGLFSSDGYVDKDRQGRMVLVSAKETLINDVADLLGFYGIKTGILKSVSEACFPNGKDYETSYTRFDLTLAKSSSIMFRDTFKLSCLYKQTRLNNVKLYKKTNFKSNHRKVLSVEKTNLIEDVWDISVFDSTHCFELGRCVTGNCGEVVGNTGVITHKGKTFNLGDVCDLGSLNLTKYYDMKTEVFNKELFVADVSLMVEALDNVIEISNYPLDMYEFAAKMKRKIGIGMCGLGSLFMMMGVRYGGEYSLKFTEDLLQLFMNTAYRTSALLAKEKGPFELYSKDLLETGYVKHGHILDKDVIELIEKHGLRNSALSAIAPTGSLAILAGNVSGGLEPVFMTDFVRWNRVEGRKVEFECPNVHKGEWFETDYLKEVQIADEVVLMSSDGKYRIDKNQGLCEEITIKDYGYMLGKEHGKTEFTTAGELSVDEHLNILSIFAKYVDLSSSKTVNLPNDISFEDFKVLYGRIHDYGVKGCTTYREGTSIAVLEAKREEQVQTVKAQHEEFLEAFKGHESGEIIKDVVKLPEEYPSKGYIIRAQKRKWYLNVAFMDEKMVRPFAVFVNTNDASPTPITMDAIEKMKDLAEAKGIGNGKLAAVEAKFVNQRNPVKIARMLGYLLRHNVAIFDIVKALDIVDDAHPGTFIFRIKKFLAQFIITPVTGLNMVCPQCNSTNIAFQEGCYLCTACGYSKCS